MGALLSSLQRLGVCSVLAAGFALCPAVYAEPHVNAGDAELRHDLEYLADRGLIAIPITTWPMSWVEIDQAVRDISAQEWVSSNVDVVVGRIRRRVARAMQLQNPTFSSRVAVSSLDNRLMGFRETPRGEAEVSASMEFIGSSFAGKLEVTAAGAPQDSQNLRLDGSYLGYIRNNISVIAGYQERWWGPGQMGSLILSNNARPVPGVSIKRHAAIQSKSRFLSWMGPWTAQAFGGRLESDRFVSGAYLLGARVAIKPFPSLELAASRTAQWGGDGRPTSFDSLVNLLLGRDNQGDDLDRDEEPGNQLAGFDGRYSRSIFGRPSTFYFQMIGEDEAGGLPSRYLGLLGASMSFPVQWGNSTLRVNAEYSDTTCQFYESSRIFDCAYNSSIYRSGYRHRNRAIGHSTDNDSRQFAVLATLSSANDHNWSAALRTGELNRGGATPDLGQTASAEPRDFLGIEVNHSRPFKLGKLELGLGFSTREKSSTGESNNDVQIFVNWTSYVP